MSMTETETEKGMLEARARIGGEIARGLRVQGKPLKAGKLFFGRGNAKLGKGTYTFSLPSGYTCPGAKSCLALAVTRGGKTKIVDGPEQEFRCFSASQEMMYKGAREARWRNYRLLLGAAQDTRVQPIECWPRKPKYRMASLILRDLPKGAEKVRVHVSGDYFSRDYVAAWVVVATMTPDTVFYSYTKSVHLWEGVEKPGNLRITYSIGGKFDEMAYRNEAVAKAYVIEERHGGNGHLEVDHDDSHAVAGDRDFALLVHGMQPKGGEMAEAMRARRKRGEWVGYGRRKEQK